MTKKDFAGGLNSLLEGKRETPRAESKPKARATKKPEQKDRPAVEKGLKPGETRATVILNKDSLEKYKSIAYWDRLPIKEVVMEALESYIKIYEKKNGTIKPKPRR